MPPLVLETLAWLRFYTSLPIPRLAGEPDGNAPDPVRTAYAAPLAGAAIGLIGGLVILIFAALGASAYVSAAAALLVLMAVTGGQAERALAVSAERLGGTPPAEGEGARAGVDFVSYGAIALALAVLLRVGAVAGLAALGTVRAALALIAAGALARAAAISAVLTHPAERREGEAGTATSLQWLAIAALAVVAIAALPSFGVVPTVAALAAAVAATVVVSGFGARLAGANRRELSGATEQISEIAFLLALLGFARAF